MYSCFVCCPVCSLKELKNDLALVEKQLSKYQAEVKFSFTYKQNIFKPEVDDKPIGQFLRPGTHVRMRTHTQTDGQRENIVHPASCWICGGTYNITRFIVKSFIMLIV